MVRHHPGDDILVEYAAGSISSHLALCVSVHLKYCVECRCKVHRLASVGGALLTELPAEAVNDHLFNRILERIDLMCPETDGETGCDPLQKWLPQGLSEVPWRKQWFKLYEHILDIPKQGHWRLTLQKIAAGGIAPLHGHQGREVTVVLQGGFSDEIGVYNVGDFVIRDNSQCHRPRALENEDCICLAFMEAPIRLSGPLGRWLEKFKELFLSREQLAPS